MIAFFIQLLGQVTMLLVLGFIYNEELDYSFDTTWHEFEQADG